MAQSAASLKMNAPYGWTPRFHYDILRTIEASYGLPGINNAASKSPITDVWQ